MTTGATRYQAPGFGASVMLSALHSPLAHGLRNNLCELRYQARRSGRHIALPVSGARAGNTVVVLAGRDTKTWWRNFRTPPTRRVLIEAVHSPDGSPPYLVHWSDTGHRALTSPGPDSYVLSSAQLRERGQCAAARFAALRNELSHPDRTAESIAEPNAATQGTR
ncbi:DUF1918 domain-containing protein [Nocardia sp. NPDC049526]|uniref:DUF1918 domain-containing protein n=1 Tax=Nocardia sp. NPDC049526 TaxID=3364316 RepID=UPI0037BC2C5F